MESPVPDFLFALGLIAVILTVTALASGFVERLPISFPLLFLGLGFALGQYGFGVLDVGPHSELLEIVATLTLALVLFLDAVKMELNELGKRWVVPVLILGPGTILIIVLGAVPLALLVGFGWLLAFIGGAILASTDPVVLREILRDNRIPRSVRQVLKNLSEHRGGLGRRSALLQDTVFHLRLHGQNAKDHRIRSRRIL